MNFLYYEIYKMTQSNDKLISNNNELVFLIDEIKVNRSNARSVNIEYDINNNEIIDNYLMTPQVLQSLSRIINGLQNDGSKAWILTGPYGSGKSFFSLFLTRLLTPKFGNREKAIKKLKKIDPILNDQVDSILANNFGYFPITISGYRASLEECVRSGIEKAINKSGNQDLINLLDQHIQQLNSDNGNKNNNHGRILSLIEEISKTVISTNEGHRGLLFVFDEMGKALEQASFHNQENDIYLLQEIAEHTNRNPNLFIGILHQSFERYATLLDNTTQREWAKVQGRFEDIPFQEPPIQQMRLLDRTISHNDLGEFELEIKATAENAVIDGWNPNLMTSKEFVQISRDVYPFHPSTLAILPNFFRRLAQNERSLFAFLTSQEPFGFQDFISKSAIKTYFRLPNLFDYLLANFQGRIYSTGRARTLSEASDRLENVNNLTEIEIKIIKTIGLLNWTSEITHINASEVLIMSALIDNNTTKKQIKNSLNNLQKRSVIVFRKFNQSYNIWQGSDVDLEERISAGFNKLTGSISLAESLEKYLPPRPLVARKHSFTTGTLRFFEIRYIDSTNINLISTTAGQGASGILFLCLPKKLSEIDEFSNWAKSELIATRADIIVGVTNKAIRMSELILELAVLNWVKEETSELRDDPVARKELRSRVGNVQNLISLELEETLSIQKISSIGTNLFYYKGLQLDIKTKTLVQILSEVLDNNYYRSPIIWNEIVNRNKLSSQGAQARKNIIHSILSDSHNEHFGYEGYPPERSVYENILFASGIHREVNGEWTIQPPLENKMNLMPVWRFLEKNIFVPKIEPETVEELFYKLHEEPYGLSFGVAPIILCAFLRINQGETTLYQQGSLLPEPSPANWDLLLSRPDLFSVAGFRIEGARKKLIDRFAKGFMVEPALMPVVRVLVAGVHSLPEHTKVTKKLDELTLAVRDVIQLATSPEKLLFIEIPNAMGLAEINADTTDDEIQVFFDLMNSVNKELIGEMDRLLFWGRDELLNAFAIESSENGWGSFRIISSKLVGNTNQAVMKSIYFRASDSEDGYAALESILAYIANRPPRNWTDMDTEHFQTRLHDLGEMFQKDQRQFAFEALLTPEQRQKSARIAENIELNILENEHSDSDVIKGALNILNQRYFIEPENLVYSRDSKAKK